MRRWARPGRPSVRLRAGVSEAGTLTGADSDDDYYVGWSSQSYRRWAFLCVMPHVPSLRR
jgi:hypothetical protein